MKYTRSAIGLLAAQYRSVLKKCFMLNAGLLFVSAPVWAGYDLNSQNITLSENTAITDDVATESANRGTAILAAGTSSITTGAYTLTVNGGSQTGRNYIYNTTTNGTDFTFNGNLNATITGTGSSDNRGLRQNSTSTAVFDGAIAATVTSVDNNAIGVDLWNTSTTFFKGTATYISTDITGSGVYSFGVQNHGGDGSIAYLQADMTKVTSTGGMWAIATAVNQGTVYFEGDAELTAKDGTYVRTVELEGDAGDTYDSKVYFSGENITISAVGNDATGIYASGAPITFASQSPNLVINAKGQEFATGMRVQYDGTMQLSPDAKTTITATADADSGQAYGVMTTVFYGTGGTFESQGSLEVSVSGNSAIGISAASDGIATDGNRSKVNLTQTTVKVQGTNEAFGIYASGADVALNDTAEINASGTGATGVYVGSDTNGNSSSFIAKDLTINVSSPNGDSVGMAIEPDNTAALNGNITVSGDTGIQNEGTLSLSGALDADVSGSGTTSIVGNTKLGTSRISGNAVDVQKGILTVEAPDNFDNTVDLSASTDTTVDIGNNAVTLNSADFATGSTLKIKIDGADKHGSITANTIKVGQNAKLIATLSQAAANIGRPINYQLLKSAEGKPFDNFDYTFKNSMFKFEKVGNTGKYAVSAVKTAGDVARENGGTETNLAAAQAWVNGGMFSSSKAAQKIADDLADLAQNDGAELNKALTAIAPNDAPVVQEVTVSQHNKLFQAITTQLARTDARGLASGDGAPNLSGISLWITPYYGESKLQRHHNFYGFKTDSTGVISGVEKKFTPHMTAGFGMQYDRTDVKGENRKDDVDTLRGFIYAEYKPSAWFVNGAVSYGHSDYDEKKHALAQTFKAHYNAETYGLQTMTGFETTYFTPEVGGRYFRIKRHGYIDGATQEVDGKDMDILTAAVGVKMQRQFNMLRPEMYVGMTYDLVSDRDNTLVTLANGSSYAVRGKRLNRTGAELNVGLAADLFANMTASIGYFGAYREDYQNHTGMLELKYTF